MCLFLFYLQRDNSEPFFSMIVTLLKRPLPDNMGQSIQERFKNVSLILISSFSVRISGFLIHCVLFHLHRLGWKKVSQVGGSQTCQF